MSHPALATSRFPSGTCIAQAQPPVHGGVTKDSPALQVLTDLAEVRAATIHPDTGLAQAELKMIHQGVRMLFVVSDMPCVDGVVTASALQGTKPMRLVRERQIKYEDLSVADVMSPLSDLDTIDMAALRRATVGQVMSTFDKSGCRHLLVIEPAGAQHPARIRGLISQTQVQRQLGLPVVSSDMATTFSAIAQALA